MKFKNDRDYLMASGQWKLVKQTPPAQKRCRVFYKGWPCSYDEVKRVLEVSAASAAGIGIEATIFHSKSKAQAAIWRSVQANGIPGDHVNYEIEVV